MRFHFNADSENRLALILAIDLDGYPLEVGLPSPDQVLEEHAGEFLDLVTDFFAAKIAEAAPSAPPIVWQTSSASMEKTIPLVPASV